MIKFIFLSLPCTTTYQGLKRPQHFPDDTIGVSNWVMRFPLSIYSSDLKEKHVFKEGEVQVHNSGQIGLDEKWRYFVITNSQGNRYCCTSQMFYEKTPLLRKTNSIFSNLSESYIQFYVPKCLIIISQLPYFKLHVNLLKVHRQLRKKIPSISCSVNQELYQAYLSLVNNKKQHEFDHIQINNQNKFIELPIEVVFDYYVANCNKHTNMQTLYIEKRNNREVLHLYNIKANTFYQISHYFHLPLSPKTVRIVISAILQEKQIIFMSNNQNLNVMLIETLMQMITPFKWHYMYVPNLPYHMIQAAEESFMPYIVGIQKKYQKQISGNERILIDVDSDLATINCTLYELPQSYEKFFTYNSVSKSYIEWEREIRINSILFMSELLSQSVQNDSILHLSKEQRLYLIVNILPHSFRGFYQDFYMKSMMFEKFVEQKYEQTYRQMAKLLLMSFEQRKFYLQAKFDIIKSNVQSPNVIDNQKHWIRYYHRQCSNHQKNKYFGGNNKSLSMTDMYRSSLITKNTNYYLSNNSISDLSTNDAKSVINKSTIKI